MALGLTDIKSTTIKNTLGVSSYRLIADFCRSANNNRWSFYKATRIRANATTKLVELYDDGGHYFYGDYRLYDHAATDPDQAAGGNLDIGAPGSYSFPTNMRPKDLNIKELEHNDSKTDGDYSAIIVDAYGSSSNRASETTRLYRWVFPILFDAETPPSGCYSDTIGVNKYPQLIQSITLTGISSGDAGSTLYLTTSLGEETGTHTGVIGVRLDTPYSEVTVTQLDLPDVTGGTIVGEAGDMRVLHRETSPASACVANVIETLSVGSSQTLDSYITPYFVTDDKYLTTTGSAEIQLWKNGAKIATLYTGALTGTDKFVTTTADTAYGDAFEWRVELISGSWVENAC